MTKKEIKKFIKENNINSYHKYLYVMLFNSYDELEEVDNHYNTADDFIYEFENDYIENEDFFKELTKEELQDRLNKYREL